MIRSFDFGFYATVRLGGTLYIIIVHFERKPLLSHSGGEFNILSAVILLKSLLRM